MGNLGVREICAADYAAWRPLWEGYNAFYERQGPTAVSEDMTCVTWGRFLNPLEPMHALVAEQAGQLVGLVHFIFHRSTISIAPTCYLQDLFTLESARGKGVGRALIEQVYKMAKEAGSSRVYWLTHESNETAMKLYDKVADKSGFIVYRKPL